MRGHLLVILVLLTLAPAGAARSEAEASSLHPFVEAVGHDPAIPEPGQQWTGFIRFTPEHNVTDVTYFICRVGIFCLSPAQTVLDADNVTFGFDTNQYLDPVSGQTIAWGVGDGEPWNLGFKFVFTHEDGSQSKFPVGLPLDSPECQAMSFYDCDATHYFVFTMPGAEAAEADVPGLAVPIMLALLAAIAFVRRR